MQVFDLNGLDEEMVNTLDTVVPVFASSEAVATVPAVNAAPELTGINTCWTLNLN